MKTWQGVLLGILIGLALSAGILIIASNPTGQPIQLVSIPTPSGFIVQIEGEIASPGVYTVPPGSRVQDLVQLAGGLTAKASTGTVNQAALLADGQIVFIPSREQQATQPAPEEFQPTATQLTGPININTASVEELDALPGIGQQKAQAIVTYRQNTGLFQEISDIMNVPGIGPGIFENIQTLITTGE